MRRQRPKSFPTNVSKVLDTLLVKRKLKKKMEDCKVFEVWEEIVGDRIAERTEPLSLKNGVLKITVTDHAWLQQLQFLKEEIRGRLNKKVGKTVVVNLYFQVGPVGAKKKELPDLIETLKKITLNKDEKRRIESVVGEIEDKSIRATIKKVMVKEAKRKKLATSKE